jgi:hypothetical protein
LIPIFRFRIGRPLCSCIDQVSLTNICPDYAYADEDLFGEFDEPLELLNNDVSYRKSYPENFIFRCCDGNLRDDSGCEVDWHRSEEKTADTSKRTRFGISIGGEDNTDPEDDEDSSEYDSE